MSDNTLLSQYNFVILQWELVHPKINITVKAVQFDRQKCHAVLSVQNQIARLLLFMGVFMIEEVWKDVVGHEGRYLDLIWAKLKEPM